VPPHAVATLGVRHFSALAYAHQARMAADLNDWTLDFTARTPGCLPSATFYPEPGVLGYVHRALERGCPDLQAAPAGRRLRSARSRAGGGLGAARRPGYADRRARRALARYKVLLGSDFPNIPYPYAHQLQALARLELGDDWLRAVCWGNAHRMLIDRS